MEVGGSVRNIWNQCVPRGHIVNRAFRCWRLSSCSTTIASFLLLLLLRTVSFFRWRVWIRRNPRKIALSLTRKTKVLERKRTRKRSRWSFSTQVNCLLFLLLEYRHFDIIIFMSYMFILFNVYFLNCETKPAILFNYDNHFVPLKFIARRKQIYRIIIIIKLGIIIM